MLWMRVAASYQFQAKTALEPWNYRLRKDESFWFAAL